MRFPIHKILIILSILLLFPLVGLAEETRSDVFPQATIQLSPETMAELEKMNKYPYPPFVQKLRSIAERMEVFPVDFIARKGPLEGGVRRSELHLEDFRIFCEFCYFVLHATEEDFEDCVNALPMVKSPKTQALILTALYIHTRTFSDEHTKKQDGKFTDSVSSWSWLEKNAVHFNYDVKKQTVLKPAETQRYQSIIRAYSSSSETAFERVDGYKAKWLDERSNNRFLQREPKFSSNLVNDFESSHIDRVELCAKLWEKNDSDALLIISDLLFLCYSEDLHPDYRALGTFIPFNNASATPKTVGQIATQLLESWEPVGLDGKESLEGQVLQKLHSIAERMEVFPVDFIARKGPLSVEKNFVHIRTEMGIKDFRVFCEFCYLALHASEEEIAPCLEALPSESPKVQVLLLTALYIRTRTWSDALLTTNDEFDTWTQIGGLWSWLEMNIGSFDYDFAGRDTLSPETKLRYQSIIRDFSSCSAVAFEKMEGNVDWDKEKSKNLFLQRGFSVTSIKTFADLHAFCTKVWREDKTEALPLVSDLLYLRYWGDMFGRYYYSSAGPQRGNASTTPKTVGQIATQLLESWELVKIEEGTFIME